MIMISSSSLQRLRTKRPTETTVSFTVSTAPSPQTITERTILCLSHCVRILAVPSVVALAYAKWQTMSAKSGPLVLDIFLESGLGQMALSITKDLDWRLLLPVGLLVLWLSVRRGYTGTLIQPLFPPHNWSLSTANR